MKGIVLAGGLGSRLYPATKIISKQLLPIYDKPMIYYPLSLLMMAGIKDILIITTERDINFFKKLLLDGAQLGINIEYKIQENPRGIAEAFILGEEFIGNDSVALILGDNIFYGENLNKEVQEALKNNIGATIFAYYVDNPNAFGVVEFDENYNVISIEEKPKNPKSNYIVPGLYFYNNDVIELSKNIIPSQRGELEITTLNEEYLKRQELRVKILDRNTLWLDTGTQESMLKASNFIKDIQQDKKEYVGCIEEIAYKMGYITKEQLEVLGEKIKSSSYGEYLINYNK